MKDISIIVPCYNIAPYIKNLLLSFHMLNLDNISYEILFVVEDNTEDNTEEIIKKYMADMNYQLLTSNGRTVGKARNVGLDAAEGKYIWFVDGDDWIINPEIIQQVLPLFKENPNEHIVQINFVSNYFHMQHYSMVWQYIFTKEYLSNFRFGDMKYQEDNDFMARVLTTYGKNSLVYLKVPSYYYNYLRPDSNTSHLWSYQV